MKVKTYFAAIRSTAITRATVGVVSSYYTIINEKKLPGIVKKPTVGAAELSTSSIGATIRVVCSI
jgi:hypothetical protein